MHIAGAVDKRSLASRELGESSDSHSVFQDFLTAVRLCYMYYLYAFLSFSYRWLIILSRKVRVNLAINKDGVSRDLTFPLIARPPKTYRCASRVDKRVEMEHLFVRS